MGLKGDLGLVAGVDLTSPAADQSFAPNQGILQDDTQSLGLILEDGISDDAFIDFTSRPDRDVWAQDGLGYFG
jgi:hypothetical protein